MRTFLIYSPDASAIAAAFTSTFLRMFCFFSLVLLCPIDKMHKQDNSWMFFESTGPESKQEEPVKALADETSAAVTAGKYLKTTSLCLIIEYCSQIIMSTVEIINRLMDQQ